MLFLLYTISFSHEQNQSPVGIELMDHGYNITSDSFHQHNWPAEDNSSSSSFQERYGWYPSVEEDHRHYSHTGAIPTGFSIAKSGDYQTLWYQDDRCGPWNSSTYGLYSKVSILPDECDYAGPLSPDDLSSSEDEPKQGPLSYPFDSPKVQSYQFYQQDPKFSGFYEGRGVPAYHSPALTSSTIGSENCSTPGIALPEIQQYPDMCQDECYATAEARLRRSSRYSVGSQPAVTYAVMSGLHLSVPAAATHDNMQITQIKHEDDANDGDDNCSEYSPRQCSGPKAANTTSSHCKTRKPKSKAKQGPKAYRINKSNSRHSPATIAATPRTSTMNKCPDCVASFRSPTTLQKHISSTHTRPYKCIFHTYGCSSTFGSKNEWKRHVSSQHLRLGIWRCDMGNCKPGEDADEVERIYNDFNRKDLFTQHVRRMHATSEKCLHVAGEDFSTSLDRTTQRCWKTMRAPPPTSTCGYCASLGTALAFEGKGAWEQRMEHIGRHLEDDKQCPEEGEDEALRDWLCNERLIEWTKSGYRLVGSGTESGRGRRRS